MADAPGRHAFLAVNVATAFEVLRVGAVIWDGKDWALVHAEPSLVSFELEHGLEFERFKYNTRSVARARRERKPLLGEHAGLTDWFVPITSGDRVEGVLVTGPFATAQPTSADVMRRWRGLTGRQGHPADPEFARYLSTTLSTLVLEGAHVTHFQRFLTFFARLLAGEGRADALAAEAFALRDKLEEARFVERTWGSVRSMVDERTARAWESQSKGDDLARIGLSRVPELVLVGLIVARQAEPDPVDQLLTRHAFQRACVELARKTGRAISGQVGDHGVMFLSAAPGSLQRRRQGLLDLGDKAVALARRFGFRLHLGLSTLGLASSLSQHYEAALGAAESALSQGARIVESATPASARLPLHELRRHLGELVEQRPGELPARFDRYLEAIAMHCGHQLEPARAHLEAGFEYLAGALLDAGALDEKTFVDTCQGLERSARDARTVAELFDAYRRTVLEMSDETQRPSTARQGRSLRRAVTYIHQHYTESLRLAKVARLAGFAPTYFSYLFKQREGMTFERYVQRLRVERAKQLLVSTDLELKRVAQLSGFGTRFYLARVFKRATGMTPSDCRRQSSKYRKSGQS